MSSKAFITAEMALASTNKSLDGVPIGKSASYVCPFPDCRVFALHEWGTIGGVRVQDRASVYSFRDQKHSASVVLSACSACQREVIFIDGRLAHPAVGQAPAPTADMPPEILPEYQEAAKIHSLSPRGAAALLRLAIQKLCPILGATAPDINKAIGELVSMGKISPAIQKALDSVRVIGNEAVHPGVMNLSDDAATALSLFGLINFIVEKAISEPNHIAAIYASLPPAKLAGITQRDT